MDKERRYSASAACGIAWGQKLDQNSSTDRKDIEEVFVALA